MCISPIVNIIRKHFKGVNITVRLVSGEAISGEVLGGYFDVVALKTGQAITYINGRLMTSFL